MRSAEGRRRIIVDSDEEPVDSNNPLFVRINGANGCGIDIHVTPTKKRKNKRDDTDTQ